MVKVVWPNSQVTYHSIKCCREMLAETGMNCDYWLKELDRQIADAEAEAGLCCKQP
jgi:hypothetical protein